MEPNLKKIKDVGFEQKLTELLCCVVCLEVPTNGTVWQCKSGHLFCASCYTRLLNEEQQQCPHCKCPLCPTYAIRNLAVEQLLAEICHTCRHCGQHYLSCDLKVHEVEECLQRPVSCSFKDLGCAVSGPFVEVIAHQGQCKYPHKATVMLKEQYREIGQELLQINIISDLNELLEE